MTVDGGVWLSIETERVENVNLSVGPRKDRTRRMEMMCDLIQFSVLLVLLVLFVFFLSIL